MECIARDQRFRRGFAAANSPTIGHHCRHSDLGRTASPIRPDMIFGKDRPTFVRYWHLADIEKLLINVRYWG